MNNLTYEQIEMLNKPIEDWDFSVRFLNWCKGRGITSLKDIYDVGISEFFDELYAWNIKCASGACDYLRYIFESIGIEVPDCSLKTAQKRKKIAEFNAVLGELADELEKEMEA